MVPDRMAAYVLAVACVFQTLPHGAPQTRCWRNVDLRIGRFRVQAKAGVDSVCFEGSGSAQGVCASPQHIPLLHTPQNEPRRLKVCVNDSSCMTAWIDPASHAWLISKDRI